MRLNKQTNGKRGFTLLLVMVFTGTAILILSGVLRWSSAGSSLTARNNDYNRTVAAAEAATEKVVAQIWKDFEPGGYAAVEGNLAAYRTLRPTAGEESEWANYEFKDTNGIVDRTYVERIGNWQTNQLQWKYSGLNSDAATYRIISNARLTGWGSGAAGAVQQDVQIAEIPIFGFGVFYGMEMEWTSLTNGVLSGRVHCNTNIYCAGYGSLTFAGDVTSARQILRYKHPLDPENWPAATVNFQGAEDWNVGSLNLPLGTNNTPQLLHDIIEIPPSPDETTLLGRQRYYNKANLIIKVYNTNVVATSGVAYGTNLVSWALLSPIIKTNLSLWDARWNKTVRLTEIDVEDLRNNGRYADLTSAIGCEPRIIYVADLRTNATDRFAVRLVRAKTLPTPGLTLATMNPLYIEGHFNAPDTGTTNTSSARPASLVCDAITILSDNWDDNHSANSIGGGRTSPQDTTVNAGVIAGIVPTTSSDYSGGLENFFRLLQDWYGSSKTLTFNGSIVALYASEIATGPWKMPWSYDVYTPPIRRFNFDANFQTKAKLPPGCPLLRTVIRSDWSTARAN